MSAKSSTDDAVAAVAAVLLALLFIAAFPVLAIWAANTLFAVGVPLTWSTWFAVYVAVGTLRVCFGK